MKNFVKLKKVQNIRNLYRLGDMLGEGAYGSVWKAVRIGLNKEFALKLMQKAFMDQDNVLMQHELIVLQNISHQSIVRVYEILQDSDNYYIATELCEGGELKDRLKQVKKFNEHDAATIIRQILLAINYMH